MLVCVVEKTKAKKPSLTEIAKDLQGFEQISSLRCYDLEIFLSIYLLTKCVHDHFEPSCFHLLSYFHLLSCFHFVTMFSFVAMFYFLPNFDLLPCY